jgi:hypothetical protein
LVHLENIPDFLTVQIAHPHVIIFIWSIVKKMYTKKSNKTKRRRLPLLLVAVIIAATMSLFIGLKLYNNLNNNGNNKTQFSPPTQQEKDETDNYKKNLLDKKINNQDKLQLQSNSEGKLIVAPTITNFNKSEIRAFIEGIAEENGTCTATAEKASQLSSGRGSGFINVSYTQCSPISWNAQLSPGTWKVTYSYKSPTAEGYITQNIEVKL